MEWLFRLFGKIISVKIEPKLTVTQFCLIRYFRNEKGTAAKMCGAIVSGIVTWEAQTRREAGVRRVRSHPLTGPRGPLFC